MDRKVADKIHEVSQKFRQAIEEQIGGTEVMVCWCAVAKEAPQQLASGITLGKGVGDKLIQQMMFRLNGRAYNMIDFEE